MLVTVIFYAAATCKRATFEKLSPLASTTQLTLVASSRLESGNLSWSGILLTNNNRGTTIPTT